MSARAPLAPLTALEISAAGALLRSHHLLDDSVAVLLLVLDEPSKDELRAAHSPRRALAQLFDHRAELVTDVVVDLEQHAILSRTTRPGAIPSFTRIDGRVARDLLAADPRWIAVLAIRGLRTEHVTALQMGPGTLDPRWANGTHRYVRVVAALRSSASPFATPVEGLAAVVDLTDRRVVEVTDVESDPPPIDTVVTVGVTGEPAAPRIRGLGSETVRVRGNSVEWMGWELQFALHPREGLVLYQVRYGPGGQPARSILARASIAEMLVPYGDVSPAWTFRNVFDVGEYGLGSTAQTLIDGQDVPEGARRFDAVLSNDRGEPRTLKGVIGIYERDGGLRWRHADRAARMRELVIRFATTVGNYDYGFSWVLSPDGVIAMEIDLTGMMQVKGVHQADPRFGVQVAPHLAAIHHQHFFSFRLDFDIDGAANRIREVEVAALPVDSSNPHGTGFAWTSSTLRREGEARRDAEPSRSRFWVFENPERRDALGGSPGYILTPGSLPALLVAPDAPLASRGAFAAHALWVTAFKPGENYPAGEFPGQDPGGAGLPSFQADDASLDGSDLVAWYTAGLTHVARPEEWPMMPVSRLRFELRPTHFATRAQ